ncbi:Gfo/Idh/MocA family protein [Variovorax saccharolyticus]|uniref:Gfo/Idh/MocA family protein n=1 Tax=Variovorax saccharolyticus TaxID=3053516 RepID=UPI002574A8D4|nr:Gfo/Idh/MocA family oxidoreductase [Variovorax sp. J22R187]MDM0019068.1 Gfo/Idh/MocA family oxidoreductase [Variovorax sp. J22R187]
MALIGLGPGSQPHLASLSELQDRVDLRWAVTKSDPENARAMVPAHTRVTDTIELVLQDPGVEAVIVATPAHTHLAIAGQALAAGKHTLVEKPLDVSLARAEELVKLAAGTDLRFGVVLQHRFRPAAVRLRELLSSSALGELQAGVLQVPWWRSQGGYYDQTGRGSVARDGGGVLLTQAIHALDLFRSLVGVRDVVASRVRTTAIHRMETEDFAAALLSLGNGAPGVLMATTAMYPGRAESLELVCTHATVSLVGGSLRVLFHDGRTEVIAGEAKSGSGDSIMDFSPAAHIALHRDFLEAIAHGRSPAVSGEEALETHRLIEKIIAAGEFEPGPAALPA